MAMTVEEALVQADRWHIPSPDTWALDVLADEVRRLRDLLAAAKWPEAPAERAALQAQGKHPAPCARLCEANAFEIEIRSIRSENRKLRAAISKTLDENGHLADGENCTLLPLKLALRETGTPWAGDETPNAGNEGPGGSSPGPAGAMGCAANGTTEKDE
jgi:hypothetical protein